MLSFSLHTATAATLALSLLSQIPTTVASMSAMTYVGCFSSSTPMTDQGSYTYQTSGYCQEVCYNATEPAMGMTDGSNCFCGSKLPAQADKVDDSNCDTDCQGYPDEECGGDGFWSVYKTGLDDSVGYYGGSSSSSSSSGKSGASSTQASQSATSAASSTTGAASATTNTPVVITSQAPGKTVVITLSATGGASSTASTDPSNKEKSGGGGGTNTAGIAAGVVVGVVVLLAIAGGIFFWMRQKKRRQIEEEYSKRSQAQDYGASGMTSARGVSVRSANDARLDPEAMMHRRLSDGSIADEQDYSRRILKVTNPDGR